jgi:hypothetical protein
MLAGMKNYLNTLLQETRGMFNPNCNRAQPVPTNKQEETAGQTKLAQRLVPMPVSAVRMAMQRLKEPIQEIDIIGHFETLDYGLLLPQTTSRSATVVAGHRSEKLKVTPIQRLGTKPVNAGFGVVAARQDRMDSGGLMPRAMDAKKRWAGENNLIIVE